MPHLLTLLAISLPIENILEDPLATAALGKTALKRLAATRVKASMVTY
jgi:hypothetical protein